MAEQTAISWTRSSFNFWIGCKKYTDPVTGQRSRECDNCYMYRERARYGQQPDVVSRTSEANWRKPLTWNKRQAAIYAKGRAADRWLPVFANSWGDFYGADGDPWRADAYQVIRATPFLLWLLLTKRTRRLPNVLPPDWGDGYANVMLGATIGHQDYLHRLEELLAVPALGHFVSAGPLLGPLAIPAAQLARLTMLIIEGESGERARPTDPAWVRPLRDQCAALGVPFHFKSWGAHVPEGQTARDTLDGIRHHDLPMIGGQRV